MKKFKKTFSKILVLIMVFTMALGALPAENAIAANTKVRQEINIIDGYLGAASGSYATSSAFIFLDPVKFSGATYYFEVVASTSASLASNVYLKKKNGTLISTISIPANTTSYTRLRSTSFTPPSSSEANSNDNYVVVIGNESGATKGLIAARVVVLQDSASLTSTQTQIEIGNEETYSSTATSSLASPKYWYYDSSKWSGAAFYAEVTYGRVTDNTASGTPTTITTAGASTYTTPAGTVSVYAEAWGAGGGSGGGTSTSLPGGSGGGGGAYAAKLISVSASTAYNYSVGAGGPADSGTGGSTSFTGAGSIQALACGGNSGAVNGGTAGTGGTNACSDGTIEFPGGNGAAGSGTSGGGGGESASATVGGNNAIGTAGGTGTAGTDGSAGQAQGANGVAGNNPGAGAGGSGRRSGGSESGAAGGDGQLKLTPIIGVSATTTIVLQEDNGSFGGWTDKVYITTAGSGSSPTRIRSSAFTPTTGRNYRIAVKEGYTGAVHAIYNAKIIVNQGAYVSGAAYDSVSKSVSAQDGVPTGITFKSDGTKMYVSGDTNDTIYQYTLSSAWDPSSAGAATSYSVAAQNTGPWQISFSSDGTKMYVPDYVNAQIEQYNLSSAWDVTSASYANATTVQGTNIRNAFFKDDGTRMYVYAGSATSLYQYDLSVPWDITSTQYNNVSLYLGSYSGNGNSGSYVLTSDGGKLLFDSYMLAPARVFQYTLGTAWDLSTATDDGSYFSVGNQEAQVFGLALKSDDSKFYVVGGSSDTVFQYTSGVAPTKFEPQMLVANTKLASGTSLQNFRTYWDPAEWAADTSIAYYHEANGVSAGTSDVKLQDRTGPTDVTNSSITDLIERERSAALTMPATARDIDVIATTNNNDIYSSKIIVQVDATQAAAPPTVTNSAASSITQTTVTLNGNITSTGGANATVRGFAYGTDSTLATVIATTTANGTFGIGAFTGSASSLTCNTTYYSRAYATNTNGTGYGSIVSFTTLPCNPTVTTQSATSITATGATLNGNITATGGGNASVRGFAWGTNSSLSGGDTATTTENGTFGTGAFTNSSLTLTCNTTYYSRAYATNSGGTGYGAISASFTTSACPVSSFSQENFRIFASSSPDGTVFTQRTPPTSDGAYGVTYGNGLFVAVSGAGSANRVMTSPDGITWTRRSVPQANTWVDVTYGNGLFVAVSVDGTNRVMTSPDGINWTVRTAAAALSWRSITFGNGLFVAVADSAAGITNGIMTSTDGITWTQQTQAVSLSLWGVTYGNGLFIAVAGGAHFTAANQILTSPDGTTWTQQTAPSGAWFDVTYGNGIYVVVGTSGSVITSPNGTDWSSQTSSSIENFRGVAYGNGRFVAVADTGASNTEHMMTSTDGVSWSDITSNTIQFNSIVYGNGMFVVVSSSAQVWTSGSTIGNTLASENTAATLSATGDIFKLKQILGVSTVSATSNTLNFKLQYAEKSGTCDTSFSGETYRDIDYSTPISFDELYNKLDEQYLVVSTTTDPSNGQTIRKQTYDTFGLFSNASTTISAGQSGMWEFILKDNGATASTAYCIRAVKTATSTSASSWNARSAPIANSWKSITYGEGIYVAVAQTGSGNRVMTSSDGFNWTARTSAADNSWKSVTYGNGTFVAVASDGNLSDMVMTSPDGITWSSQSAANLNAWNGITYGNGLFVAVAGTGAGNRVMTSPDGVTWTQRSSTADNVFKSITYGNGLFVAVASNGGSTMISGDGINWSSKSAANSNQWESVTYGNGRFVAVADSGTGNRAMYSLDGVTWTLGTSAADDAWIEVTYGNGIFVAVSLGGTVMTSPDGITWTLRTAAEANTWRAITYNDGQYVAISSDGTNQIMTASSTDTLLDTYTYIPEITTAAGAGAALSQLHYRWRNDYGTESGASYAAAEDTSITTGVDVGDRIRLRFLLRNTSGSATNYKYRLETASSSCSAWMQVASSTTASPHWVTDTTTRVADGEATTDSSGLTNPAGTFVPGYVMTQDSQTPALSLTSGQFTELEYSIRSTSNISTNTVYCFRLTNAGVTTGFTFSQQPQITIPPLGTIRRLGGGGGNAGGEANGTGPIIPGGTTGGGGGSTGGSGGGQNTGGGGSGGGGGDIGYLWDLRIFTLLRNLFFITDPTFSFGYILKTK